MEKRKNETIYNLEKLVYEGRDNKEIEILKEEMIRMEDEIKDLNEKNTVLISVVNEKN